MDPIKSLVARADRYARRNRIKRTTVSKKLFNDTNKLDRLAEGKTSVTVRVLSDALGRLADLEDADRQSAA